MVVTEKDSKQQYTDPELIKLLVEFKSKVGEFPVARNCNKWSTSTYKRMERVSVSLPSVNTFNRHFGTYTAAKNLADELIAQSALEQHPDPDLIRISYKKKSEPVAVEATLVAPDEHIKPKPFELPRSMNFVPSHPSPPPASTTCDNCEDIQRLAQDVVTESESLKSRLNLLDRAVKSVGDNIDLLDKYQDDPNIRFLRGLIQAAKEL